MKSYNNSNNHDNNKNQNRVIDTDDNDYNTNDNDADDDDDDRKPAARILVYDTNNNSNNNSTSRTDTFSNNTTTTHTSASTDDDDNNHETDDFNDTFAPTVISNSVAASATATATTCTAGRRNNDKTPMKSNSTNDTYNNNNKYLELMKKHNNNKIDDTMSYYSPSLATITTVGSSTSTLLTTTTTMNSPSSMTVTTKSDTTTKSNNNNNNIIGLSSSSSIQQLMTMLNIPSIESILTSVLPLRVVNILQNTDRGVIVWTITSTISFGILIHEIIPRNVMIAIIAVCMSLGMLLQRIQILVREWYNTTIINGNGIGETLLSSRIYTILLQQSLHDFMTTNVQQGTETPRQEYRHLLLYLLPLSIEQRNALVQRLTPSHQNALHRPGLVHWLPAGLVHDNCMKLLIGTNRFNNLYNTTNSNNISSARNQQRLSARVARSQQQQQQQQQQNVAVSQQLVSPGSSVSIPAGQSSLIITTPLSIESNNNINTINGPNDTIHNNIINATTTTTTTGSTSRIGQLLLNADDESVASDLGLDVSDNDFHDQHVLSLAQRFGFLSASLTTTLASSPAAPVHVNVNHSTPIQAQPPFTPGIITSGGDGTTLVPSGTNNDILDEEEDDDDVDTITSEEAVEEGNVLLDAILYAFNNVIVHPANRVSNVYVLPYMTNQILRWSTRIFTMSASIGTIGYIGGLYPTIVLPSLSTVLAAVTTATATTATTLSLVGTTSNFRSTTSNINISSIYPSAQSIVTLMTISGGTSFGFAVFYKYLQYKNDQRLSLLSKDDDEKK